MVIVGFEAVLSGAWQADALNVMRLRGLMEVLNARRTNLLLIFVPDLFMFTLWQYSISLNCHPLKFRKSHLLFHCRIFAHHKRRCRCEFHSVLHPLGSIHFDAGPA